MGTVFASIGIVFEDHLAGIVAAMAFVSSSCILTRLVTGSRALILDLNVSPVPLELISGCVQSSYIAFGCEQLLSGAILSWARGISEFGAVVMIAFYPMIAPVLIYYRFTTMGLKGSQPIAVLLIIICLSVFLVLRLLL